MHGLSRLGSGVNSTPSTSPSPSPCASSSVSPPSSPLNRRSRNNKNSIITIGGGVGGGGGGSRSFLRGGGGGGGFGEMKLQNLVERLGFAVISTVYRRRGVLLLAPLLYISVMLLYMGTVGFDSVVSRNGGDGDDLTRPGSLYRSPQVFEKLWPFMQAESNGSSSNLIMNVWTLKPHQSWKPCIHQTASDAELPKSNGFLIIEANGGLNQQRLSICDAVAVAGLLNATLVIPMFHFNSVWRDSRAVRVAPFSNRLAHAVPPNIQGLRCLSNFEALRFSESIRMLAAKMVDRMVKNSSKSGGKYISVHLRFEEDMVAFSCCVYDGGEEEKREMDIARERSWRGKFRRRGRIIRPGANRRDGKCPLTPLEVGMMLRGMGFDNNTFIYVAAGKIYQAEKYMAPLKQMFPHLETKDTLASPEELAPFKGHSSRLAALDYTVCLHSEVFVSTQGGNFPHFLVGHRRYLYEGHAKTIKPDKRKLALLFDNPNIRWEEFKRQLQDMLRHSDVKGIETRKPSGSLYTYPMPDCMCKHADGRNDNTNTTGLS